MFTIRDWTLKEQHNLSVIALSSVTGFVVTLFFLNSTGITDINARMAVTLSGMFLPPSSVFANFIFRKIRSFQTNCRSILPSFSLHS